MITPAPVPIDQRFAQLIQQFGLTKNSFAISLGKTASVVQHLIDGRNKPGYDLLCKVFEIYPNVSRDWLLLGRGPMLVGGEPAVKAAPPAAKIPVLEPPLEPIDLTDVETPATRRSTPGVAGTRLQPSEIAATLALAAAANQPARTTATAPFEIPGSPTTTAMPAVAPIALAPVPSPLPQPVPLPAAELPASVAPVSNPAALGPETYVAAALHAQHLQHQLALAELRNQTLHEQQQMLRERLAMARQAMV